MNMLSFLDIARVITDRPCQNPPSKSCSHGNHPTVDKILATIARFVRDDDQRNSRGQGGSVVPYCSNFNLSYEMATHLSLYRGINLTITLNRHISLSPRKGNRKGNMAGNMARLRRWMDALRQDTTLPAHLSDATVDSALASGITWLRWAPAPGVRQRSHAGISSRVRGARTARAVRAR
jgi:hypothetical protein